MKKIISCLLLSLPLNSFAQQTEVISDDKKFHLAISAGVSQPIGNFGNYDEAFFEYKQDYNSYSFNLKDFSFAGEAKTGFNIQLDGGYKIGKIFGIVTCIYSGIYQAEEKTLTELFPE